MLRNAISSAIIQEVPEILTYALENNAFVFSGFKTFHALREVGLSLTNPDGSIKSFERFLNDVQKINKTYNQNYLRAEYNFASASAEMAARWEQFMDDGDRYYLQYRTAADSKVRPEHAALHGVTLPIDDPFWEQFYPPNGWNCRCSVSQVRKSKYPATPHNEAMALGEVATQRDTRQMFRFNPGKEPKTFPAHNPYTISRCKNCDIAKGKLSLVRIFVPDNEVCAVCKLVRACYDGKTKESERQRIEGNRKLYDRLSKDKRYKDVEFNPTTGALKATHVGHNEGSDEGFRLEKKLVNGLYSCGHSIILADEQKKGRNGNVLTSLDMILDGVRMDIKSITKNKAHYGSAIRAKNNQLIKFNARTDTHEYADTLCMYFDNPTMFAPSKIMNGYEYMKSKTSKDIQIKHIVCVINSAKGMEIKTFDFE